jgi:ATP-dependent exoDNAse (exonuclease V) beta subunit
LIKASAGSGKTHRLTGEYLHLLFQSPGNYSHILAVTFTNKATDEMKSRIVEELHRLASGEKSGYLGQLMSDFALSEAQVRAQAKSILETILHDYSSFSISTIDRFFQQTMRAFTREMGLSGGYNVEVDDSAFLPEIIDRMIFELDRPENQELARWLLLFMKDRIEDSKGWSIKNDIAELAGEIFNETYKSITQEERDKIHDRKQLDEYKKALTSIVRSFENQLKTIGQKALGLMDRHALHYSDFKYGKTSGFSFFVKLANGNFEKPGKRFQALPDKLDEWGSKPEINAVYADGLNDCVKETLSVFESYETYNSAKIVLNYFYTLGILNDVQRRLREFQQENNTLFLSDTTELLNKIIDDSDAPFVYEKTGTRINSYMIDEFQDTSRMQWANFSPLVRDSLASNHFNLIVGDVKQSIYRWRNSDWTLLEEKVPQEIGGGNIQPHSLDTNWRSDAQVVRFNNAIFRSGAQGLQNDFNLSLDALPDDDFKRSLSGKITAAYAQAFQHVPEEKAEDKGQVKITFLNDAEDGFGWREQALERLPKDIEDLQRQGFALKDIAIVVRWNYEAVEIAERLLRYKEENPQSPYRYDIISNEALVVGHAQSVKAIIALLRYFRNPGDAAKKMLAVYEFYRFHRKLSPDTALQTYFGDADMDFPESVKRQLEEMTSRPLYELAESFFLLSKDTLDEKENAYVQAFLDIALKFSIGQSADVSDFLDWWDEKGYRKTLFSPDNQDAIRLITIHKSKGLGFGAVVMPFVDWGFDHNPHHRDIFWCRPQTAPFNMLSIVPLRYSSRLMDSIFRNDYLQEKLFTYIDNLNLLYVAFTRAKNSIVAYAPRPNPKKDAMTGVADLLWQSISNPDDISEEPLYKHLAQHDDDAVFEMGKARDFKKPASATLPDTVYKTGKWQSVPFGNRLKMSLESLGYFSDDGSREYGTLMHGILSRVARIEDLDKAVDEAVSEGAVGADDKETLIASLKHCLSLPEVADWYSGKYQILNEMQILHHKFGFNRPDRVMLGEKGKIIVVDYKFGNVEESRYLRQVKHYMGYIEEMGYANVQGFVFYVRLGKVIIC